ncbi:MAG: hypothetical protein SGILL_008068, partial [Bacillariaceae sp.]
AIRAVVSVEKGAVSYKILNELNQTVFVGGDIAAHIDGQWCVAASRMKSHDSLRSKATSSIPLKLISQTTTRGIFPDLGAYEATRLEWTCHPPKQRQNTKSASKTSIITSFYNFDDGRLILFRLEWPHGAKNTSLSEDTQQHASMAPFPSFLMSPSDSHGAVVSSLLPDTLSWQGSFVQSVRGLSEGSAGGPTIFYNGSDPLLNNVIVASQMGATIAKSSDTRRYWNTFTAGNNMDWSNTRQAFSPGTSGRIKTLPPGYQQNILIYEARGITSTLAEWGSIMKDISNARSTSKVKDVTLEKIGIQTDNGAYYCFCQEKNCSETLLKEKAYLDDTGIRVGYLSYQGAGTSTGRGKAAPWCIEKWSADGGGQNSNYPMDLKDLQKALGVPLQLYSPYFCPNSTYFGSNTRHNWRSVSSNPDLPGCSGFAFETASASESKDFFSWYMAKGISAGMQSFESDFMNQNINCVQEFIESATATDDYLYGMADAAQGHKIPVQWCYASPNEVFSSLDMPSVTNFRVSFDFCYGKSYDIGESSLLVWALGGRPSKDTLWSTDNNKTEIPGCKWTADHEAMAAELHIVLALLTAGPFGLSDGIGMSNATLLQRAIAQDGTLLQPSKPVTAIDSSFLTASPLDGYVYGTYATDLSWLFVSFQLKSSFPVRFRDFWPTINDDGSPLVHRSFSQNAACQDGLDAVASGCVKLVSSIESDGKREGTDTAFTAPASTFSSPGSDLVPSVVTVWTSCPNGMFLLGELEKYVSLSPKRFEALTCTGDGIKMKVRKTQGEIVKLTFLIPQTRASGEVWYQIHNHDMPSTNDTIVSVAFSMAHWKVEKVS